MWIAVGGTPQSVVRAGTLGLPLALAIIGGAPERFAPLVELYRDAARQAGHDPATLPVGINSHAYVRRHPGRPPTSSSRPTPQTMTRIGRERGWPPMTRGSSRRCARRAARWLVGSPAGGRGRSCSSTSSSATTRFLAQISVGAMPHAKVMRAIELLGTEVAPVVREEVARRTARAA